MTKSDFGSFKDYVDRKFLDIDHKFKEVDHRFKELELKLTIKLGLITVSTTTVAVAILAWLIQNK